MKLCDIFDEAKRVLRKDGTCWVNMGDTYWGGGNNRGSSPENLSAKQFSNRGARGQVQNKWTKDYKAKSLCLIPQRFAIEMVNRGWILRNVIIWHKPNCMPSSVKDRFTVNFEYVFFFVKNNKTLFWTNEVTGELRYTQPLSKKGIEGKDWHWLNNKKVSLWRGHDYWFEQQIEKTSAKFIEPRMMRGEGKRTYNGKYPEAGVVRSMSKNKRAVWTIPTRPFPGAHFAVFPEKLIEPMIQAGCPRYVCKKCGKARVKIYKKGDLISSCDYLPMAKKKQIGLNKNHEKDPYGALPKRELKEIGYTDCGCIKLTCLSCGIVLYYTKEEYERRVNNAIQEYRKKTGIYEELDEVQIFKEPRKSKKCPEEIQKDMSNVQKGIPDKKKSDMLQSEMCSKETSDRRDSQQLEFEGRKKSQLERGKKKNGRLPLSSCPKSSESNKGRLCNGTSSRNGKTFRKISGKMGGYSSQEWDKGRQPDRESGINDSQNTSGKSIMSLLQKMVFDKIICPKCKSNKFKVESAGFEGGICLDPFMGAGTTAVVAKKQGKQYLGIELKQEYIDMANKRIKAIPESLF